MPALSDLVPGIHTAAPQTAVRNTRKEPPVRKDYEPGALARPPVEGLVVAHHASVRQDK
jgi:hypothetical protein